jgi:hypothetical protein
VQSANVVRQHASIIDTSALMTILRDEPEAEICARENVIGKWVRGGFSLGRPAQNVNCSAWFTMA